MKKIIFLILLIFAIKATAQDGSNIRYIEVSEFDDSYLGEIVHLDFYNKWHPIGRGIIKKQKLDTILIKLDNRKIVFIEHRVDNGLNNWFSEQYLESKELIDGYKIRIKMAKILEITSKEIKVSLFLEYRDENGKTNTEKPNRIECTFAKDKLARILVKD